MKKHFKVLMPVIFIAVTTISGHACKAQGHEMQQLLLNIEKLTQLKGILTDMKTGYQIYQKGYGTISSLAQGNFSLHEVYLNGLLQVNPAVKSYGRVAEILSQQANLLGEYKSAYVRFEQSKSFSVSELNYMSKVYGQLVRQSLESLDELTNILTTSKLRMSDAERIRAIDRIYAGSTNKLQFLRYFNRNGMMLSLQRSKESGDATRLKELYGFRH